MFAILQNGVSINKYNRIIDTRGGWIMTFICIILLALLICGVVFFNDNIYFIAFCIPAIMFIGGLLTYSVRYKPGSIRGFKTGASERNADTWEFANRHYGIKMMKWSVPVLAISELAMFLMKPEPFIAELMVFAQAIPIFAMWVSTEHAINKQFDYHGNRRDNAN